MECTSRTYGAFEISKTARVRRRKERKTLNGRKVFGGVGSDLVRPEASKTIAHRNDLSRGYSLERTRYAARKCRRA
jgi:hypothetical protein